MHFDQLIRISIRPAFQNEDRQELSGGQLLKFRIHHELNTERVARLTPV